LKFESDNSSSSNDFYSKNHKEDDNNVCEIEDEVLEDLLDKDEGRDPV
jgi:hypothetical protein